MKTFLIFIRKEFYVTNRTFCKICANNVLFKPLTEKDECYLCNPKHLQFTVFAVKDNWRENMLDLIKQMFDSPDVTLLGRLKNKTDGIVVLSLFDGISSGNFIFL